MSCRNDITREMLHTIRFNCVNEEVSKGNGDSIIPITNNVMYGQHLLDTVKANFNNTVHLGANFDTNPLYLDKSNNVLYFSGKITTLNDLNFLFIYNDPSESGCYIRTSTDTKLDQKSLEAINQLSSAYSSWELFWRENDMFNNLLKQISGNKKQQ